MTVGAGTQAMSSSMAELMDGSGRVVDPDQLRLAMSQFATGITIVTAYVDRLPYGVAANALMSVSLDPPLVAVGMGKVSDTWPHIRRAGTFALNILRADQQHLCVRFATKGADRFALTNYAAGVATGAPILVDASLASLECRIYEEVDAGDHVLVLGLVLDIWMSRQAYDPLVFFRRSYLTVGRRGR